MRRAIISAYGAAVSTGLLVLFTVMLYAPVLLHEKAQRSISRRYVARMVEPSSGAVDGCVPQQDDIVSVGGLNRLDVPRMDGAFRTDYSDGGSSEYVTENGEREIFDYYLSKLSSQCWQVAAVRSHDAYWSKGDDVLRVAVVNNPYGGRVSVRYETLSAKVLGVTYIASHDPSECTADQMYCAGYGCYPSGSTCPTSGSTGGTTSCPTPPTGCTSGFTYDANGCATSCYTPPSGQCTSTYSQGGTYSCNYSTCPNGCTYDSSGCPSGCYTSPTCSGSYQQPGSSSPQCNYSTCPNGCNWSNGCPSGCYAPTQCSGAYQQSGVTAPTCNYAACPNGCMWDSVGCPSGCSGSTPPPGNDQASCTSSGGLWCQPTTSPHCHTGPNPSPCESDTPGGSSCPSGQYWCNGGCVSNSTSCGSSSSCPSGQYWCNGACVSNSTSCGGYGNYNDQSSCTTSGGLWCQPTTSPHCHPGPNPSPCEADTLGGSSCPTGQYWCNGSCIANSSSCGSSGTPSCPSGQFWCSMSNMCIANSAPCTASNGSCGQGMYWCQSSYACIPNTASCSSAGPVGCSSGQYMCNNACVSIGASCNGYPYYPPGGPTGSCSSGYFYCLSTNSCVVTGSSCSGSPASQCSSGSYWCSSSNLCLPNSSPCGSPQIVPITNCPSGMYWCESDRACKTSTQPCGTSTTVIPRPESPCPSNNYWCPSSNSCVLNGQPCGIGGEGPFIPGPGDGGISDEERDRIDEERFQMMKRNLKEFSRGVAEFQKHVARVERRIGKTVAIPPELKEALNAAKNVIADIEKATTVEEIEDVADKIMDISYAMREWGPKLGDIEQLYQMLKGIDSQSRKLDQQLKRYQNYAKRNSDIKPMVDELAVLVATMKATVSDTKALAKIGDVDTAVDKLQEFYDIQMPDVWNLIAEIEMVRNVTQGMRQARSELRRNEREVKALERGKKVSAEVIATLKDMIENMKDKLAEVEALAKQKPVDIEELKDVAGELWEFMQEFEQRMAELGRPVYYKPFQRGVDFKYELPEGFDFGEPPVPLPTPIGEPPITSQPAVPSIKPESATQVPSGITPR